MCQVSSLQCVIYRQHGKSLVQHQSSCFQLIPTITPTVITACWRLHQVTGFRFVPLATLPLYTHNWSHPPTRGCKGDLARGQCWRAHPDSEDGGELVDWPTLPLPRPRTRVRNWPTPSMNCWSTWRGRSYTPRAAVSPWHRGVPVRTNMFVGDQSFVPGHPNSK